MRITRLTASPQQSAPLSSPDAAIHIVLNEHDLAMRLADAKPGDVMTYHVGMLARDRWPTSLVLAEERRIALNAVADRVRKLADAGWVHLLQRRVGDECFAYLLVVRPWPRLRRRAAMPVPVPFLQAA